MMKPTQATSIPLPAKWASKVKEKISAPFTTCLCSLPLPPSSSSRCLLEVSLKHWPGLLSQASPWHQASLLPSKDDCDGCSTLFGCLLFVVQIYIYILYIFSKTKTFNQDPGAGYCCWLWKLATSHLWYWYALAQPLPVDSGTNPDWCGWNKQTNVICVFQQ